MSAEITSLTFISSLALFGALRVRPSLRAKPLPLLRCAR
jgi:hypothetical protein